MDHLESQLAAADVELPDDVLDHIDEIVPPGVTINPADSGWVSPALQAGCATGSTGAWISRPMPLEAPVTTAEAFVMCR